MPRQAFCLSLFPYETHFLAQVAFLREYFSFRRYCSGKKEKFAKPSFFWYDEKENVQNSIQNKIFVEIEKTLREMCIRDRGIIEGLIRIAIFLGYLWLISRMKEIKRVFQYHGAEHKTIACFESGKMCIRDRTTIAPKFKAPELQLKVTDADSTANDNADTETKFTVTLDNAKFVTDVGAVVTSTTDQMCIRDRFYRRNLLAHLRRYRGFMAECRPCVPCRFGQPL